MNSPYLKLVPFLQQKGVSLEAYVQYLSLLSTYEKLNVSLTHRGISLQEYYHYLEQTSFSTEEFALIENFGQNFLAQKSVHLDEVNQWLKDNVSLGSQDQKSLILKLLQHLFKTKKVSVEEFIFWSQFSKQTKTETPTESPYRLKTSCGLKFCVEMAPAKRYGPYLILGELGRGGMGIVYKAYHPGLHRIVALKVLRAGEKASEILLKRFRREIEIMAKLQHSGIVQIYDSGMEGQEIYLAMEYIQGKSLSETAESLTLREKLTLMQQMLEALEYAHQQGILHRDLKLENILITPLKEAKIADFGLAKSLNAEKDLSRFTKTGILIGTVPYMAPELARSESDKLDERTDIYAVGVCLYKLLTQQYPFEAKTLPETLNKIITQEARVPSVLNKEIRSDLDTIILKALEKEPAKRYKSAKAMAEDLERFLAGYSIQTAYSAFQNRWGRWKRKYQGLAIAGIGVAGFVVFLFGALFFSQYQARTKEWARYCEKAKMDLNREEWEDGNRSLRPLLSALRWSNHALTLDSGNGESEKIKWSIGKELLKRAYEQQLYRLAGYVIEEMQGVQFVSDKTKSELRKQLTIERERVKTRHLRELRKYLEQLQQNPRNTNCGRDAVFEISQMSEPEIEAILMEELQQGNQYLLQPSILEKKVIYYCWIVRILGRTQISACLDKLFQGVNQLSAQLIPVPERDRMLLKYDYLIELTEALGLLKGFKFADSLVNIRVQMGTTGLFWNRTQRAFIKLLGTTALPQKPLQSGKDYFENGNRKIQQGDYSGALKEYTMAIQIDPNRAEIFNNRGLVKNILEDLPGAIQDFTQSIRLQPYYVEAYVNRGAAKELMMDLEGAISDLDQAIQMNPNLFEAYNSRGSVYKRKGDYQKSYQDYSEAIRCNHQSPMVYRIRSFGLYNLR
ncbi:MAG: protein kinase, partial [Planctomycetota bacterium]